MNSYLSKQTIALHWIVGLFMITLVPLGLYMSSIDYVPSLYYIHKSLGTLSLFFILYRVVLRLREGWPTPASQYQRYEQIASKFVHWVLIIATVTMPVSGVLHSGFGGYGVFIFEIPIIPNNYNAELGKVIAYNKTISEQADFVHIWMGKIVIGAFALHIIGALKHHFIDKDHTLKRMFGK